ncbi:MAG TPA: hypothetical protein VKB12_09655 [Pyrinomonadaceae bacterium]|nr:hypothetical protein [Pyrinomonadaceae bacterium]
MRKTLGIATLMLAFCCPALAGEIPNPPAPQPQGMTVDETATTDVDFASAADTLTQIALDMLAVLPSLF